MSMRSSSTMRVMVVRATSAATRKKMKGKNDAMASMRSASEAKLTTPKFFVRSMTSQSGGSMSSISFWASASSCSALSSSSLASAAAAS